MAVDETVQVRCTRCKAKFRDKARRLRSGYSRQCPSCERMLFFEDGSPNKDIHDALRDAERVRKALRAEEAEKVTARAPEAEQAADGDSAPTFSRRMDRRSFSTGRSS